ncbi:MAG: hypothetical protein IPM88_14915 [Nitrospira sp.]|nr:hypothetical protein [Nitrospira sp.]
MGAQKKIRELLAAQEDTNRPGPCRTGGSSSRRRRGWRSIRCFRKVRFDVLIADEAPHPRGLLLAAAGLVRERIVLCGILREVTWPVAPGTHRRILTAG